MTILIVGIILAVVIASLIYYFNSKKSLGSIDNRVFKIKNKQTQPSGLQIWLEDNASITMDEITAIEEGLTECFSRARVQHYDSPLNLADYKVAIIGDCVRAPESKNWCYKLPIEGSGYEGTEWDLGGYLLASGQTIAIGEPYGNIISLPEHKGTDLDNLARVAGYEAEHVILAHCDGEKFESTKIHGAGQGHPLF